MLVKCGLQEGTGVTRGALVVCLQGDSLQLLAGLSTGLTNPLLAP